MRVTKALSDLNVVTTREFYCLTISVDSDALLDRKDIQAVLPTGYGKSMKYQTFARAKDYQMNGKATILVILRWSALSN